MITSPDGKFSEYMEKGVQQNISSMKERDQEFVSNLVDSGNTLKADAALIYNDLQDYVAGEDLLNITVTGADVAVRYLQEQLQAKIDAIKQGLTTYSYVTIGALVKEVSPYVKDPAGAANALKDKIISLLEDFGPKGSFWVGFGEGFISYASSDPTVQATLANLNSVKLFADLITSATDIINAYKKIYSYVEPLIPAIKLVADLFEAIRNYNAPRLNQTKEEAYLEMINRIQRLLTFMLGSFRKYIYAYRIKMPNLLLGAIEAVSIRDAVLKDWSKGDLEVSWIDTVLSEDFYSQTVANASTWKSAFRKTYETPENFVNNWGNLNFTDIYGNPISRGEFMKSKFTNTLTKNFLGPAVKTARKDAKIRRWEADFSGESVSVRKNKLNEQLTRPVSSERTEIITIKDKLLSITSLNIAPFKDVDSIINVSHQLLENNV